MVVRGASCGRTRTLHSCTGATAKPAPSIYTCRRQSLGLSQSAAHSRLFGATRNITTRINATCSDRKAPSTMTLIGFNLVEELTFYGAYHNNPVNQLIHFIFVPLILWTVAVWLAYTPALFELDLAGILFFLPPGVLSLLSE